jgi:hypothetical protein
VTAETEKDALFNGLLVLAGKHNPKLLAEYVAVERRIGHTFRQDLSLAEVQQAVAAGDKSGRVPDWTM